MPSVRAIGISTIWNGMKQPNRISAKMTLAPLKVHLVST